MFNLLQDLASFVKYTHAFSHVNDFLYTRTNYELHGSIQWRFAFATKKLQIRPHLSEAHVVRSCATHTMLDRTELNWSGGIANV